MKKIFAIALALVMVLSMTAAFASECNVGPYDWSCATSVTNCGKATVEVIPLVKVNDACGTWKMEVSNCAAAVTSNDVYYAIKLTIDKNVDLDWYGKATLTVTAKGANTTDGKWSSNTVALTSIVATSHLTAANDASGDGYVYYLGFDGKNIVTVSGEQTEAEEKAELKDVFNTMKVSNASKAKVCATLKSENKFTSAKVGSYTVSWVDDPKADDSKWNNAMMFVDKDGNNVILYMDKNDKVQKIEANVVDKCTTDAALIADVLAKYNLGCGYGQCITYDAVKANFGWKDKVESCFSWSDKAPSVVDAECVVAIPKTGDKGLLWWLF